MSNISPRDKAPSKVPEYIPIVSTFTAVKKLIDKIRGVADTQLNKIKENPGNEGLKSHEYEWLCSKNESSWRSAVALIPVLGNIVVAVMDRRAANHVRAIETDPKLLENETADYQRLFLLEHEKEVTKFLPYVADKEIAREWLKKTGHDNFKFTHVSFQVDAIEWRQDNFESASDEAKEKYVLSLLDKDSEFKEFFDKLSDSSKGNVIKQNHGLLTGDSCVSQCIEGLKQLQGLDLDIIFTKHPEFVDKMKSKDFAPLFEKMSLETKILLTKKMKGPTEQITIDMLVEAVIKESELINKLHGDLVVEIVKKQPYFVGFLENSEHQVFVAEKVLPATPFVNYKAAQYIAANNKTDLIPFLSNENRVRLVLDERIAGKDVGQDKETFMKNLTENPSLVKNQSQEIQEKWFENEWKSNPQYIKYLGVSFQKSLFGKDPSIQIFTSLEPSVQEELYPSLVTEKKSSFLDCLSEQSKINIAKKNPEVFEEEVFDDIFNNKKMGVPGQIECIKNIKDMKRLVHVLEKKPQFVTVLTPERQVAVANEFVKNKKSPVFILKYVDQESGKYIAENEEYLIPCLSERIREELVEEKYIKKEDVGAVFDFGKKKNEPRFINEKEKIEYICKSEYREVRMQLINEDVSLVKKLPRKIQKEWCLEDGDRSWKERLKNTSLSFQLFAIKQNKDDFVNVSDEAKEEFVLRSTKPEDVYKYFNKLSEQSKRNVVKRAPILVGGKDVDLFFPYAEFEVQHKYLKEVGGNYEEIARILEKFPNLINAYDLQSRFSIAKYFIENKKDPTNILQQVNYEAAKYIAKKDKKLVRFLSEKNQNQLIEDKIITINDLWKDGKEYDLVLGAKGESVSKERSIKENYVLIEEEKVFVPSMSLDNVENEINNKKQKEKEESDLFYLKQHGMKLKEEIEKIDVKDVKKTEKEEVLFENKNVITQEKEGVLDSNKMYEQRLELQKDVQELENSSDSFISQYGKAGESEKDELFKKLIGDPKVKVDFVEIVNNLAPKHAEMLIDDAILSVKNKGGHKIFNYQTGLEFLRNYNRNLVDYKKNEVQELIKGK